LEKAVRPLARVTEKTRWGSHLSPRVFYPIPERLAWQILSDCLAWQILSDCSVTLILTTLLLPARSTRLSHLTKLPSGGGVSVVEHTHCLSQERNDPRAAAANPHSAPLRARAPVPA
jgi:hypothetical protein